MEIIFNAFHEQMSSLLEEPQPAASARDRPLPLARRSAKIVIRLAVVAVLAGALGAGWYLARKGFGRQWRHRVVEELHKRGVEARIGRLTLDPFRGLVAQDVRIFDYKKREKTLAVVSEISLDINYAALLHHQPFLNALDVRNAQITLPLKGADGKSGKAQLTNFHAHVYFPPEQIYVSQAEGIFCGVRISASGQLIKRENYQPSPPLSDQEWHARLSMLRRVAEELKKISFPGGPPWLQVKFSGDLAQIENAHVEATLRGERLRRGDYEMRDLFAAAEWSDQTLDITQCEWRDNAGGFAAQASWSRQRNLANFQVRSSLDLKSFLTALGMGGPLADATFNSPPHLELSGSINFAQGHPQLKVIGHASADNFSYKTVPFSNFRVGFSWDGKRTLLHDVHVVHPSGELRADILDAPGDFRLNVDSTINPGVFRVFASPDLQELLSQWEWPRPPSVHLAIRGQDRHPENWHGEGTISMGRARFRGVWAKSASAKIHFGDGAVTYDNLRVTRDEGVGTGSFTYDFAKHEVRVGNIKATLWPADVIFWIDPKLEQTVTPYKFRQPPNIAANGLYQFGGGKKTRLEIHIDTPGGMAYDFLKKTLPFNRISSELLFTTDRLQIVDLKGALFSGTVSGGADISLAPNDSHYNATIAVKGVNFPRLTYLYYNYKTAQGELNATYDFSGPDGNARKMDGSGKLKVTNGDVFAIPVFGPLSQILNHVMPGAGYSIARNASASFTVNDGIIHTGDFDVAGKLFDMVGHGNIYFLDDRLDFDVRINPKGPGVLLAPVYKLFEYKGEGSLSKPNWHPKRF
jgi:AsmA-like C-terminal region